MKNNDIQNTLKKPLRQSQRLLNKLDNFDIHNNNNDRTKENIKTKKEKENIKTQKEKENKKSQKQKENITSQKEKENTKKSLPLFKTLKSSSLPTFKSNTHINNKTRPNKDFRNYLIDKCNTPKCQSCPLIPQSHTFKSTITGKIYSCHDELDCSSKDIIYLITCKKCGLQYIGETEQTLKRRVDNYRS